MMAEAWKARHEAAASTTNVGEMVAQTPAQACKSAAKQRKAARLNHERACAHKSKGTPSTGPRNGMSCGEVDTFACSETILQRCAA